MKCPVCSAPLEQAGATYKCDACNGAWVEAEVLVPLLEQSAAALIDELDWQASTEDHVRKCPACETAMQTVKLGTVALDRCAPHGVWFDSKELAQLLRQAKNFRAEAHHHESILRKLAKLI